MGCDRNCFLCLEHCLEHRLTNTDQMARCKGKTRHGKRCSRRTTAPFCSVHNHVRKSAMTQVTVIPRKIASKGLIIDRMEDATTMKETPTTYLEMAKACVKSATHWENAAVKDAVKSYKRHNDEIEVVHGMYSALRNEIVRGDTRNPLNDTRMWAFESAMRLPPPDFDVFGSSSPRPEKQHPQLAFGRVYDFPGAKELSQKRIERGGPTVFW